ncbi:MAG: two-component regulator propeller domain-containing protein [Ekhidna sp.]
MMKSLFYSSLPAFFVLLSFHGHAQKLTVEELWLTDVEVRTIHYSTTYGLIAGLGDGIVLYDSTKATSLAGAFENAFPVSTLFEDGDGNLWIGGLGFLRKVSNTESITYAIVDDIGLDGRVIFSVFQDENQNIWTSAPGGAAVYKNQSWKTYQVKDGLKHHVVHDVCQDKNNNMWFATRKGGVNILGKSWEYKLLDKNSRKLLKDDNDQIWVGASEGLFTRDNDRWISYESGKTVLPMFQDGDGRIWCVAGGTGVLIISETKEITRYEKLLGNEVTEIYAMTEGHRGDVWLATDKGVFRCRPQ